MQTLKRGLAAVTATLMALSCHAAQVSVHDPVMAKEGDIAPY